MSNQDKREEPIVRMREKNVNSQAHSALARANEVLNEGDITEETEEIRKLDSQLDHLNDYMSKMEERIKAHSDRMMETLRQQKEEREKRRRSFHERMSQNQSEDEEFKKQITNILKRVESVKKPATATIAE
ncbi:unnamed protein product [Caenorhabditis bovis]|uniref:Uncharacterized protein n=1 Tax=Caenorhabditis bovis TaxID=2654633 RepID=A0A8S1E8B8_9PELO|nr:unnamed protein product [Caenorhabditis bovis]